MIKKRHWVLVIVFLSTALQGCILQFTNDLKKSVFITDDLGKGIYLTPGSTQEINPTKLGLRKYLAKERLYFYYEMPKKETFQLLYRLIDDNCTDDAPQNQIKMSEIDQKNERITQRFRIKDYKA